MPNIFRMHVCDRPGVLGRIASLIRRNGVNISNITSGTAADGETQTITLSLCPKAPVERLQPMLTELSDTLRCERCEPQTHMLRELLLARFSKYQEHLVSKDMRVILRENGQTIVEYVGDPDSVTAAIVLLVANNVAHCRSGILALPLTKGEE